MGEQSGESQADTTTESTETSESLDSQIAAALKDVNEREDAQEASEETTESESEDTETEDTEETEESSEDDTEDEDSNIVSGEEEEVEVPEAPKHWSKEDKEVFESLDDDKKQWWLDKVKSLENGYQEKFQEVAAWRKEKEALDEVFSPYDAELQASGMQRTDVVKRLVAAQQYLEQKPQEAIEWFARSYGVDLGKQADPDEVDDPYREPESRELSQLKREIAELKQSQTQQEQIKQQQEAQQYQAQIQQFAEEVDESGEPKRPHFESVKQHMAALLGQGQAKDLQDAYDQAVWANPETRAKVLEEQEKAKESKRKTEVKKAKKAGKNVKSKQPASKTEEEVPANLNDLISSEFDKYKQSA